MKKVSLFLLAVLITSYSIGQITINEICPANGDLIYDSTFYNFSEWVELHNAGNSSANIGGFFLSDDQANPTKWRIPQGTTIPAKGYLIIWCDDENTGLHTNFSLDSDGEEIILSNSSGVVVDNFAFPKQYTNISFGRIPNGSGVLQYLKQPTPSKENKSSPASIVLDKPEVSVQAGKYQGEQTVTLKHSKNGVSLFYTLDGSEPSEKSLQYSGPIVIAKTSTLKSKAFHPSYLPSLTEVTTYLLEQREFSLPVVSLSINPKYLYNDTIGIYVIGTNGVPGGGMEEPVNWNQNWFRHADFEYFKPDGELVFHQPLDVRIYGNYSRRKPQKSFALKARDKFGKNNVDHKLFPSKDIYRYGGFLLRNSGTDWNVAHFRDALMQHLTVGQLDLDYMDYQPVTLFLNGDYWGIINLRERIDGDYFKSNYGIDNDDIDILEMNAEAVEGTRDHYVMYLDSLKGINRGEASSIKFIERYIDVQNFINYQVHNMYIVNTDWPDNNIKYWRQRSNNGKFRWILWDTDFGFGTNPLQGDWSHETLKYGTNSEPTTTHNKPWSTLHLRLLLENPVFKQRFIQTFITSLQTTYDPQRIAGVINEFETRIETEMPFHKEKWGGKYADWATQIENLKGFAPKRNPFLKQHIIDFFELKTEVKFNVKVTPENAGGYSLNGNETQKNLTDGFSFKGLPFHATAIPKGGYQFKHWKVNKKNHTESHVITIEDSWKYFDKGSLPGSTWTETTFDDNAWSSGQAQFGYGDNDEKTKISFGPDKNNKFVTTYFRKEVDIVDLDKIESISGLVHYDDGAVIYVNGIEVLRPNMPTGNINYSTFALTNLGDARTTSFTLDKSVFKVGKNIIAAEVHQITVASSDVSFDLSLTFTETTDFQQSETSSVSVEGVAYSDVTLEAVFEPINNRVIINEFSTSNTTVTDIFDEADDWIELYNPGSQPADIAGLYITDDLNNKKKFRIPSGSTETIIQPGDYLLLWADNQPAQGPTHLNFKLADEGEAIGIYYEENAKMIKVDEIIYGLQMTDQSWSRIPNATGPFGLTYNMTPLAVNTPVLSSENASNILVGAYPNPTDGKLNLIFNSNQNNVGVFDLQGRQMMDLGTLSGVVEIELEDLPVGVYIVRIQSGIKNEFIRIVKK